MEDGSAKVISILRRQREARNQQFQETHGPNSDTVCEDMSNYFKDITKRNEKVAKRLEKLREVQNSDVKKSYRLKKV